eukprot:6721104-Pyramimonas_sp.AAC.1
MEDLLGGFQADLGNISTEIKTLQEQSLTMSIKLRNRKTAEAELGKFVEGLTVPPRLVTDILDREASEDYLTYLVALRHRLEFCSNNELARKAAALQDVEPELDRFAARGSICEPRGGGCAFSELTRGSIFESRVGGCASSELKIGSSLFHLLDTAYA